MTKKQIQTTGNKTEIQIFINSFDIEAIYSIKEIKETRSGRQNRMYWQWLGDIVECFDEQGIFITRDDLHEGLRDKLIKGTYEINPLTGRRITKRKSTAELNKKEFSEYIKDIEKYLIDQFYISYPLPTDFFYEKKIYSKA